MLRHIDSRDEDTARYGRNSLLLASTLILGAAIVPGGLGSSSELHQSSVPPSSAVSVSLEQDLESIRSVPVERSEPSSSPEAAVEAFTDAWAAGDRVAARRAAGRGTFRDLTRLANRYAIAEESTGHASAICSPGPELFCRVYLPHMLEVDARLAERHGEFVVLGFKLPRAG
jgi:hypothetical protein